MAKKLIKSTKAQQAKQESLGVKVDCTALYVRVSTERQAGEGFSLDAQQERLQAYCIAQGWNVCPNHIYIDAGLSGKTDERPALQAMLKAAQEGEIVRIVAMKLDRLARNVRNFLAIVEDLKVWDCSLVLVKESFDTSTPHGKFALTMFAAMAELEASTITERVMTGKAQKATEGGYNGSRTAYGYTYANSQFSIVQDQADVVRSIYGQWNDGKSMHKIADTLNAEGFTTASGKEWSQPQVRYILLNGLYAGLTQWNETEVAGSHPAIIKAEAYHTAIERVRNAKRGNPQFGKVAKGQN